MVLGSDVKRIRVCWPRTSFKTQMVQVRPAFDREAISSNSVIQFEISELVLSMLL